jgi:hypothetical protein
MPIGKNVQLGREVRIFHPDLVNLYDCVISPDDWIFEDEGYSGANLVRPALGRLRDSLQFGFGIAAPGPS